MKTNMKVQELLNKDSWTKGCNARDAKDTPINVDSPEACRWCLWGAILKCYPGRQSNIVRIKVENAMNRILTAWNDEPGRSFEDVEKLIKEFDL